MNRTYKRLQLLDLRPSRDCVLFDKLQMFFKNKMKQFGVLSFWVKKDHEIIMLEWDDTQCEGCWNGSKLITYYLYFVSGVQIQEYKLCDLYFSELKAEHLKCYNQESMQIFNAIMQKYTNNFLFVAGR